MRSFMLVTAAAALAFASPVPQSLDFDLIETVDTPANVTIPTDITAQNVTYDATAAASAVVSSVVIGDNSVDLSDSTSAVANSTATLVKRGTCATQAAGSGPVPSPDTASAFLAYSAFASAATSAPTPSGYTQAFNNLNASNNAYGYLGFTTLTAYDSALCAKKCNAITGCAAFNLYFERDPTVDPGTGCTDPASTTAIKCVFWGGPVTTSNANNYGQYRSSFEVVIAGSNGYVNNTIEPATGYSSPNYLGNAAIDANTDCNGANTTLGSEIFTSGPFDASLCAAACDAKSAANVQTGGLTCKFFNTYLLSRNGVAIGQYCQLYSQTWASTYATNTGSTSNGNKYTISYSYSFSSSSNPGVCSKITTTSYPAVSSKTAAASATTNTAALETTTTGGFLNWTTFKANGANLGSWLEKEQTHDPIWWDSYSPDTADEWHFCESLGDQCGPVLEARYASFLNTSTIDKLASVGVNSLRIPTTYAAWVDVPGSQLYHGNQQAYLKTITDYAISKYGMHCIIGLHSLPGGVNNLDIGEALLHDAWFFNATNLAYSYDAIDAMLDFIVASGHTNKFTVAPINEASDNLAGFGTAAGLSSNASDYIVTYMNGVLDRIAKVDSRIPMMIQDCFKGAAYWAPYYESGLNIVFDSHVYYFAAAGTYSEYVNPAVCGQAAFIAEETKFPVFIGEWSLQVMYNNTLASRQDIFNTQRYAWSKYVAGGTFWTAVSYANGTVDGEGDVSDYWSYVKLIDAGVIQTAANATYC